MDWFMQTLRNSSIKDYMAIGTSIVIVIVTVYAGYTDINRPIQLNKNDVINVMAKSSVGFNSITLNGLHVTLLGDIGLK